MSIINVNVKESQVRDVVQALQAVRNGAQKAFRASINKAVTGGVTDMARETGKFLNLTQKRIKKDISVTKATLTRLSGAISSKGRPVNLIEYGAKKRKKGVSIKIWKKGKAKIIPGTFIFKGLQGKFRDEDHYNEIVAWRRKTEENKDYIGTQPKRFPDRVYAALPRKFRFPLQSKYGPRIQDITAKPRVLSVIEYMIAQRLEKELDHQVEWILSKQKI